MSSDRPPVPLLEFDPAREAFIEPPAWARHVEVPSACVVSWFSDAVARFVADHQGRMLFENRWEDGPHPLYAVEFEGLPLTIAAMPVGAPAAAGLLEQVIANGCRSIVACGGAGALKPELTLGHLVVLSSAIRDEGTSYHYLPPARTVEADPRAVEVLEATLAEHGVPFATGRTWTTDAYYRETPGRIASRRDEECLVVEMEAAALLAVAHFRGVPLVQVVYGGDDLSGVSWDHRDWTTQHDIRDNLVRLAAGAALRLDTTNN